MNKRIGAASLLMLLAGTLCYAKPKKPKAPKPESCIVAPEANPPTSFCFTPLYWNTQDNTIYSVFENRSTATVSSLMFTFTVKRNDLIIGSAHSSLAVPVPPGGRAEISARVAADNLDAVIESVHVYMKVELDQQWTRVETDAAVYPPLFANPAFWPSNPQRAWNKANGY
jgi:hypothetical protein